MLGFNLTIPVHRVLDGRGTVYYMDRPEGKGNSAAMSRLASRAMGAGLLLGNISKAARLSSIAFPAESGWTSHVSLVTGHARSALSLPHLFVAADKFMGAIERKEVLSGVRDGLDVCSSGNFAASILVTDKATASLLGGIGGVFKAFVDGIDLGTNVKKMFELVDLRSAVIEDLESSLPIQRVVESEMKATGLKIGRFVLALFAGVLTALAFVFKVVIAKELLVAGVVASLGSLILSLASEWTAESGSGLVRVPSGLLSVGNIRSFSLK